MPKDDRSTVAAQDALSARREAMLFEIESAKNAAISAIREAQLELKGSETAVEKSKQIALREVGQEGVERTLKIVTETRNWLLFVFGIAATVGIASFIYAPSQFENELKRRFEEKVNAWLSYSVTESPVRESLGQIKKRALIDSLMIKAVRERMSDRPPLGQLSPENQKLLLEIIQNKDTPDALFVDALKLLKDMRPKFMIYPDRETAETYAKIFAERGIDNNRKYQILETQYHDPALYPISEGVLKGDYPLSFKTEAFRNYSRHKPEWAAAYARRELSRITQPPLRENWSEASHFLLLLEYLAKKEPESPDLRKAIDTMKSVRPDEWRVEVVKLALVVLKKGADDNKVAVIDYAARLLSEELTNGVFITNSSSMDGLPMLASAFSAHKFGTYFGYPGYSFSVLVEKPEVLSKVIAFGGSDESVLKCIKALEISQDHIPLANVVTWLGKDSEILTTGGRHLSATEVNGPVWIKFDKAENTYVVDWQGKNGLFFSDRIRQTSNLADSTFKYSKLREFYSLLSDGE